MFLDKPAKQASLDMTIETRDGDHAVEIMDAIKAAGYSVERLDARPGQDFGTR